MNERVIRMLRGGLLLAMAIQPQALLACAACYGQSDSPMARGMNWGILSLLGVVVCVLATIATFFVYLGRKAAAPPAEETPAGAAEAVVEEKV
jgi:hypothetical protein